MASTEGDAGASRPRALSKRFKGSLARIMGQKMDSVMPDDPQNIHWRPSVNSILSSSRVRPLVGYVALERQEKTEHRLPTLLRLPKELRHLIESYLPRADIVCLRQTCRRLRYESKQCLDVKSLNSRQKYSLRKRLDQDYFTSLCELENTGHLGNQLAACSFCHSIHDKGQFTANELSSSPQERECRAVAKRYLICGHYWAYPTILRRALEDVIATGRDEFPVHHWVPREESNLSFRRDPIILSRAIENDKRLSQRRSTILIDKSGLVVEHHFHLQSQSTLFRIGWDFQAALASPLRGMVAVCPHLTVYSAGIRIGIRDVVLEQFTGHCPEHSCRTDFGWFECTGDAVGMQDLCFRVRRSFGWVENVTDGFWSSQ